MVSNKKRAKNIMNSVTHKSTINFIPKALNESKLFLWNLFDKQISYDSTHKEGRYKVYDIRDIDTLLLELLRRPIYTQDFLYKLTLNIYSN